MGLVLPLWSDTLIHLDGDGGFSVSTDNRVHIFKPVSVQAMWSALQSLHKACEVARSNNYYPGSLFLTWVSYYESHINSDQSSVNEWNAMQDVQSHRPDSPALFTDVPTERERTERLIKTKLREIMMQKDLENITSKEIRTELEMQMVCNLREFKEFIDNEMIVILGQMDSPTQIFDHVFLGSEWNASNLEDLQNRGVRYILNVTREIDNFFPGLFEYHNIRVYDEEATDLLAYWNDTYKFISKAKKNGSKCLVHCKMGVSRSASTVIAYAMKEYGWNLDRAYDYVKERRTVTKPNPSFMRQLEEYQGILLASKQRHNKLWRSHSDSDLSDHHEPICKPGMELNKKEITTSADRISEAKPSDSRPPASPAYAAELSVERRLQGDAAVIDELCTKERRIHLEFTSRDFHAEQIEDELNLNNINGCSAGCCLDESKCPLDNCHASEALMQLDQPLEIATDFPDLTVDDLEKDALKPDMNVHLVPMEELAARLKDLPRSPDQDSPSPQLHSQPEAADFSTDRIDFFSALEKFVELSQESRSRSCSHSRPEEQGSGRNGVTKGSVLEVPPAVETGIAVQRTGSLGNSPQASEDSSTDEEQAKEVSELPGTGPLTRSHSENSISVKEIVTEIESIHQGVGPGLQKTDGAAAPKRNTVHELPAEAGWPSEHKPGKAEPGDGICTAQQEKAKEPLQAEEDGADPEESSPAEDQQELQGEGLALAPKWCPGSVRRATLEFEERLRQEQEQQHGAPGGLLPTRKNSRNDPATTEPAPRGRSEEPAPAHGEGDSAQARPGSPEPPVGTCPVVEPLPAELGMEQEGPARERRTVVLLESSAVPALPGPLPKRIEIIEYPQASELMGPHECDAGCGQGGTGPGTATPELPPLDENLNPSVCTGTAAACLQSLPLHHPPTPGPTAAQQASTPGSPEQGCGGTRMLLGATSPLGQAIPSPSADPECLSRFLLEGVTEQSTSTDDEPAAPCSAGGGGQLLCGGSCRALMLLSHEDLTVLGRLAGGQREPCEGWDFFLCSSLPHSSSSRSVEGCGSRPSLVQLRATKLEERMRHAGLTAPSHMKRSASLAKLDCLDLSKDDLAERERTPPEPCPHLLPPGSPPGRLCTSSSSLPGLADPKPTKHFVEQLKTTECIAQSKPVARPLVQYAKEFRVGPPGPVPGAPPLLTRSEEALPLLRAPGPDSPCPALKLAVAPRQQHGRTHPLRRLKKPSDKKRTPNPLYNTM